MPVIPVIALAVVIVDRRPVVRPDPRRLGLL